MNSLARSLLLGVCVGFASATADPVDYLRDIKPVFKARCYACHGALQQKSGLRVDTALSMLQGGKDGPVVAAGKPSESSLIERITASKPDHRMPPEGEPLSPAQIDKVRAWIAAGATVPPGEKPEPDPREHWAFRPPTRPAVPRVQLPGFPIRNPIDAFIADRLQSKGLLPRVEADRAALLRRVYIDLIGIPPTRDELHAFLTDPRPDAYEQVVDSLLGRTEHGERWARHWMDVWRYADWYGRRQVPDVWNSAPQIWRWRDWIVQSLNRDKGYHRMLTEMLAADELNPADDETAVATGYLVRNWYALNPNQWMRDNVEHTAKAFLGLTINCAHCHDHKYDPISQKDYFRFRAFFEPLGLRQDRIRGEADPGPFQKYEYSTLRKIVKLGTIRVFDERPEAKTALYLRGDERQFPPGKPTIDPGAPQFLTTPDFAVNPVPLPATVSRPGLKPWLVDAQRQDRKVAMDDARRALDAARESLDKLDRAQIANAATNDLASPSARASHAIARLPAEFAVAHAQARLDAAEADAKSFEARLAADVAAHIEHATNSTALAEAAARAEREAAYRLSRKKLLETENNLALLITEQGAAAARRGGAATGATPAKPTDDEAKARKKLEDQVADLRKSLAAADAARQTNTTSYASVGEVFPERSSGRRLALARWLTQPGNPLTARVGINHLWARHIHQPIVSSVFDFGRNGAAPTHPELLDWIAVEWMESGWSMKHIHRLIVTSSTYRQASSTTAPAAGNPTSPNESISIASGSVTEHAPTSIDPENRLLWRMNPGRLESETLRDSLLLTSGTLNRTIGGASIPHEEADKTHRRSLYLECHPEGGGHGDFMELFDPPDPSECYRRTRTVVPQQALAMSNSKVTEDASRALAARLSVPATAGSPESPESERTFARTAFEQILARPPKAEEWVMCAQFLRAQSEQFAREPVAGTNSVASASPALRARESLVRALFNHNDFLTVR